MFRTFTLAVVALAVVFAGASVYGQTPVPPEPELLSPVQTSGTVTWSINVPGLRSHWAGSMVDIHILDQDEVGGVIPTAGPNLNVLDSNGNPTTAPFVPESQAVNSNHLMFTLWHKSAANSGITIAADTEIRELDLAIHVKSSDDTGLNDGAADIAVNFLDIFHFAGGGPTAHFSQSVSIYVQTAIQNITGLPKNGPNLFANPPNHATPHLANPGEGHWIGLPGSVFLAVNGGARSLFWKSLVGTPGISADIQHGGGGIPEPLSFSVWGFGALCGVIGLTIKRRRNRSS